MTDSQDDSFNASKAEVFEALGHPTRIRILQELSEKPLAFSELKRATGLESNGLLTFHLGKLKDLVELNAEGAYALTDEGVEALRIVEASKDKRQEKPLQRPSIRIPHPKTILAGLVIVLIILATASAIEYNQIQGLDSRIQTGLSFVLPGNPPVTVTVSPTHSGTQSASSQGNRSLSTYTISQGGTFYSIAIQSLNESISVSPGGRVTADFNVSSPTTGTFYVGVGENGSVDSPGIISEGTKIALPPGITAAVTGGDVINGTSHVLIPVVITASDAVNTSFSLELFVYQHQNQVPGGFSVAQLSFNVEVRG